MDELLKDIKNNAYVVGIRQVLRCYKEGSVLRVYMAADADALYKQRLTNALPNAEVIILATMQQLAQAADIDVPTASIAILK